MKKRSGQNWALEDLSGSLFVGDQQVGRTWKQKDVWRPLLQSKGKWG